MYWCVYLMIYRVEFFKKTIKYFGSLFPHYKCYTKTISHIIWFPCMVRLSQYSWVWSISSYYSRQCLSAHKILWLFLFLLSLLFFLESLGEFKLRSTGYCGYPLNPLKSSLNMFFLSHRRRNVKLSDYEKNTLRLWTTSIYILWTIENYSKSNCSTITPQSKLSTIEKYIETRGPTASPSWQIDTNFIYIFNFNLPKK